MALSFGTSGLRGLVVEMIELECRSYTFAFIQVLRQRGLQFSRIALAGDLRSSTPEILRHLNQAIRDSDLKVDFVGYIPTPALALYAIHHDIPGIMVTGSHIPDDRNGIKFYLPSGEILKQDEQEISNFRKTKSDFESKNGTLATLPKINEAGKDLYLKRYSGFCGNESLRGLRIGLYEHSAVGRDIFAEILSQCGADVIRLERSEKFIPVDTEAVENVAVLKSWVKRYDLAALVSTDGDSDRPLLVDDKGDIWGGDQIGLQVAKFLTANIVVTPINSTSGIELSGAFPKVERTKIGSPFVVEAMSKYFANSGTVVGFEANGGFLLGVNTIGITPLPTRDAVLPILVILRQVVQQGKSLSTLRLDLPQRHTQSALVRGIDLAKAQEILFNLKKNPTAFFLQNFSNMGDLQSVNILDGIKLIMTNFRSIHFRPSGNAPEFRIYSEAESIFAAQKLCEIGSNWIKEDIK